jgi:dienelactone hydrolase
MKKIQNFKLLVLLHFALAILCLSCASHQSVNFQTAPAAHDSLVLKGNLYKPKGDGQFPAVVVLHGCAGIDYHFRAWAEQLKKWGYVVLIVDSFSPRGVDRVCGHSYKVPDLELSGDAYGAAIYLKQLPYVDSKKIGLMGFSRNCLNFKRFIQFHG